VYWDDGAAALVRLAERAGIPVFTNAMGRGAIPHRHPLAFAQARKNAFRGTDLAIVVGTPLDFRVGYGSGINAAAKVVQVDRDATKIAQNRAAEVALLGDARSILGQLAEAVSRTADTTTAWVAELREAETKAMAKLQQWANTDTTPINHYRLARAIAESIDDDTIVIGDGGDCVALGAKLLPRDKPGTWMDPGPLGCLGIGAPFAIAAKKLHPGKKVLVLSGDGSFGLNGFDFETCVRWKLPVTVVVANDAAWGQIRGPQVMIFGAERSPATKLAPTRYDRVMEVAPTIKAALADDAVTCINVPVDPEFVVKSGAAKLTV
jgi:acetolactate synthase-1/2/3 large subunit